MLQTCARKYNIPIDQLKLDFIPNSVVLDQEEIEEAHKNAAKEVHPLYICFKILLGIQSVLKILPQVPEVYKGLETPEDGVLIHGLAIDAGRWDFKSMLLVDANIGKHVNTATQFSK